MPNEIPVVRPQPVDPEWEALLDDLVDRAGAPYPTDEPPKPVTPEEAETLAALLLQD